MGRTPRSMSEGKHGAALAIRVAPRARKDEIVEILADQTIKIRLAAPPVDGKANKALIEFLAKVLDVPRSRVEIIAGASGRDKLVSILDLDSGEAQARIQKYLKS